MNGFITMYVEQAFFSAFCRQLRVVELPENWVFSKFLLSFWLKLLSFGVKILSFGRKCLKLKFSWKITCLNTVVNKKAIVFSNWNRKRPRNIFFQFLDLPENWVFATFFLSFWWIFIEFWVLFPWVLVPTPKKKPGIDTITGNSCVKKLDAGRVGHIRKSSRYLYSEIARVAPWYRPYNATHDVVQRNINY